MSALPLADCARDWALWLTRQRSVTGTPGERALGEALCRRMAETPALRAAGAVAMHLPVEGDRLGRACAAVLVKGQGAPALLLTGHYDTVPCDDYGDLAHLATDPEALAPALLARLRAKATSPAELRARADLESGAFLPGRGLLDMKAGLAAGLAAMEAFAADPARRGNLLFIAVPDEEVNSVGARDLARVLPLIERDHDIRVAAAINLDAIADDADGSGARVAALGSVGKLLLTAFVVGQSTHASYPFAGFNAAALAGALAAGVEWSPALADPAGGAQAMPPTLLSLKDGKAHYDVTTPASAFAIWNALSYGAPAQETFARFQSCVRAAADGFAAALARRRGGAAACIDVIDAADLLAPLCDTAAFDALARQVAAEGLDLPEQSRRLTQWAFARSGRAGPAIVVGLGSLPYPAVKLGDAGGGGRLRRAIAAACAGAPDEIAEIPYFPGISDMSFIGAADLGHVGFMAAQTPAWRHGVGWQGKACGLPCVNIGPWGRDYHTPLERLQVAYAFDVLPKVLLDAARGFLE